jgi:hypothetical protein
VNTEINAKKRHHQPDSHMQLNNYNRIVSSQRKAAQTVMILKFGKPPKEVSPYRTISLLEIMNKIFDKLC